MRLTYLTAKSESVTPIKNSSHPPCLETDTNKKQLPYLQEIAKVATQKINSLFAPEPAAKINRECIAAAMKRNPGDTGILCTTPKSISRKNKTNQCINDNTVDYIHFAVNSAIQCMSSDDPIDSRVLLKKFNNETAFHPSIASKGGVGLGQMTSIAVNEISQGQGRYILENIAASRKTECKGFRDIAAKDLEKNPRINSKNFCPWVSPGDGLARNLIYSIGYYLTLRDQYIIPAVERRSSSLSSSKDLINDLTNISYGPEGLKQVEWILQKYRVNNKTSTQTLQSQVNKNSKYLEDTKNKMHELTCIRKDLNPAGKECENYKLTIDELKANTCISN
ncbi:MAG TPA: hypothetical protein VIG33_04525 [Pseudobdellovibrionaceae bacterium]